MDSSEPKKRKIRKRIIFHDNANKQTQSCVQILMKVPLSLLVDMKVTAIV